MSNCLQTIIINMALDSKKLHTLQSEIKTFLIENSDSDVTWKALERLPYLDACLKEGLRYVSLRVRSHYCYVIRRLT